MRLNVGQDLFRRLRVRRNLAVVEIDVIEILEDERVAYAGAGQDASEVKAQLLEFLGFGLLIGTFIWVFKKR